MLDGNQSGGENTPEIIPDLRGLCVVARGRFGLQANSGLEFRFEIRA
jgi:hypothetical protein